MTVVGRDGVVVTVVVGRDGVVVTVVFGRGLWRWIDDCGWERWGCGDGLVTIFGRVCGIVAGRFTHVPLPVLMDEERHRKAMSFEAFQMSQQLVSVLDQVEPSCDGNLMSLKNPMKRFEYNTEVCLMKPIRSWAPFSLCCLMFGAC